MRVHRTQEEESNLNKEFYFTEHYYNFKTMMSMVFQMRAVLSLQPASILEIGKGNGFVSEFISKSGHKITTFDINKKLKPDVVGSIENLEKYFSENKFDCVLCGEVLEHLPFENFEKYISKMSRITSKWLVLTLPNAHNIIADYQGTLKLPKIERINYGFYLTLGHKKIPFDHHWEIWSSSECSLRNILKILKKYFNVNRYGRIRFNPYHFYFILEKQH